MLLLQNAVVITSAKLWYLLTRISEALGIWSRASSFVSCDKAFHLTFTSLIFGLTMLCSLSVGGAPAVSSSRGVNKLRALHGRRHGPPWPVTLPAANWPSAKGQTSVLLLRPSPAPPHPLFVPVSPHRYLPRPSRIPVFHLLCLNVSVLSSLPSFLFLSFISSSPLVFRRPPLSAKAVCSLA